MLPAESNRNLFTSESETATKTGSSEVMPIQLSLVGLTKDCGIPFQPPLESAMAPADAKSDSHQSERETEFAKKGVAGLIAILGDADPEKRKLAQKVLERFKIPIQPHDLIEHVKLQRSPLCEAALTALKGFYGIPREQAESGAKLGAGIYSEREQAQRYFEKAGVNAIPLISSLTHSKDAEIASRADRLMSHYYREEPLSELAKHPQIQDYLPKEFIHERRRDNGTVETLTNLAREVDFLRLCPEYVKHRIAYLDKQDDELVIAVAIGQDGASAERWSVREELKCLRDLPLTAQEIEISLAKLSKNDEDKRLHFIRAMEKNPGAPKNFSFVFACEESKMFDDKKFCKAFVQHGGDSAKCQALRLPPNP